MIKVRYDRDENKLTVQGHAKSNTYGRDLVCAAASTLAVTMSVNVRFLADGGYVENPVIKLEEGYAEISCKAAANYAESVRQVFMSVCVGFEMLAAEYPDYISYTCVSGNG